jgi:hypothetical protein
VGLDYSFAVAELAFRGGYPFGSPSSMLLV